MAYTYSPLASYTVDSGGIAAITFSNIPQNYTDLCLLISGRDASYASAASSVYLKVNGVLSGYTNRYLVNSSGTVGSGNAGTGDIHIYNMPGANATTSTFGNALVYIPNYTSSTNKSFSVDCVMENNSTAIYNSINAGLFTNSTAINYIQITCDASFAQYSTAYLYGIRVEY